MYMLHYSKEKKIIEVKKRKKIFENLDFTEDVKEYNENYFYSSNAKKLKEKAKEIKNEWLEETKNELEKIEKISI